MAHDEEKQVKSKGKGNDDKAYTEKICSQFKRVAVKVGMIRQSSEGG